jgi:DNA invertase Pin-like site-specific DNA recombinase
MEHEQRRLRVVGYPRVSAEEQAAHGVSLSAQRTKIELYCALHELDLVKVIEDAGVSAKSLDRPGLSEVLAMLDESQADGIVITKLDRLTRSLGDWLRLIETYFGERVRTPRKLFSVGDSIDTRTAAGRLVLNVLMSVAQWERETIGERTKQGMEQAIAMGRHCGTPRYGWEVNPHGIKSKKGRPVEVICNEHEQRVIRLMKELRSRDLSLRAIVEQLREAGIETREGGIWTPATINKILARETNGTLSAPH